MPSGLFNNDLFKITSLNYFCADCNNLSIIQDFTIPQSVLSANYIFANCTNLIDASNIKFPETNRLINYEGMFYNDINLLLLPEFKFRNFSKLNCNNMFYNCINLHDLSNSFKIPDRSSIDCINMCYNNYNLTKIPSGLRNITDNNNYCFANCSSLITINNSELFKRFDNFNITTKYIGFFANCINLTTLSLKLPNSINDISYMLYNCSRLNNC